MSDTPKSKNTNMDELYGKLNASISDQEFEAIMQDGVINDGEWAQIAAKAGLNGVSVEVLAALKDRFQQSWHKEHEDAPAMSHEDKQQAKEAGKKINSQLEDAEEVTQSNGLPTVSKGQGRGV